MNMSLEQFHSMIELVTTSQVETTNIAILLVWLVVIFWIYSLLWVVKDISWRTSHLWFQLLCIFIVLVWTPILWLPIYFLIRPIQSKDINITLRRTILASQTIPCQSCKKSNVLSHEFCAFCWQKLKRQCQSCKKHYPLDYSFCPHCGGAEE